MAKKNNTILWVIGIVILLLVLTQPNIFKKQEMIKLTPHYYKDGVEVFPQEKFLGLFTFIVVDKELPPINGECISHEYSACYNNDVYWYDSCGVREELKEDCGALGCNDGICNMELIDECIFDTTKCEGTYYYKCVEGVWVNQGQIDGKCGYGDVFYNQISFSISGIATGVSFSNIQITEAYPLAFKNALPTTTQSLLIGESKILWNSDLMNTSQFEGQTINFLVKVSAVDDYTGKTVYTRGYSGDISFGAACTSHATYSCYSNDIYWYDSCGVREEKKIECGTSAYTGNNYCYANDVYKDYITIGCSGSSCTSSTSRILQEDCGTAGCSNGVCNPGLEGTYTGTSWNTGISLAGITTNGVYFWITDHYNSKVYKYNMNGVYLSVWSTLGSGCKYPTDITTDGNYIWITDYYESLVHEYDMDGTYTGVSWNTDYCGYPTGITTNGEYLWVTDQIIGRVCNYDLDGTFTGEIWDTEPDGCYYPWGITTDGSYFWVVSNQPSHKVHKYDMAGNHISLWITDNLNSNPYGITTHGSYFWVTDGDDEKVYKYNK